MVRLGLEVGSGWPASAWESGGVRLPSPAMSRFSPEACHGPLLESAPRRLRITDETDLSAWRAAATATLRALLGEAPAEVPIDVRVEWVREHERFTEKRFLFAAEANADVPAHLLLPRTRGGPWPLIICLQGHTTGMHVSLGRDASGASAAAEGDRDFAIQAVERGFAALAIEQRCFGERSDRRPKGHRLEVTCHHASMTALLLGRTMIGERVWDVRRAIDAIEAFPEVDNRRIGCMGNSGGGTITYFAACLDERIRAAMPSCYVCTFKDSIASLDHCADNYVPGILRYFEMSDLAGLIAPRPLVVVAGREDPIFPFHAVERTCREIETIYARQDAAHRFRLVVGEGGHRFYAEQGWRAFRETTGW